MALDTKQKQGSAIGITLPFRPWLTEPVVSIGAGEQLSLLKLCSEPTAAAVSVVTVHRFTLRARIRSWTLRSRT